MRMVPALVREYLGVCQSSVQTFDANLEHHSDMGGVRRQQQESRMRTVGSQPNDGRVHDVLTPASPSSWLHKVQSRTRICAVHECTYSVRECPPARTHARAHGSTAEAAGVTES